MYRSEPSVCFLSFDATGSDTKGKMIWILWTKVLERKMCFYPFLTFFSPTCSCLEWGLDDYLYFISLHFNIFFNFCWSAVKFKKKTPSKQGLAVSSGSGIHIWIRIRPGFKSGSDFFYRVKKSVFWSNRNLTLI